jgi:hypothetical protein
MFPDELYLLIFQYLFIQDISRINLVSNRFHSIVQSINYSHKIIIKRLNGSDGLKKIITNIELNNTMHLINLSNLRILTLNVYDENIKSLSRLNQIEALTLHFYNPVNLFNQIMKLTRLKYLKIKIKNYRYYLKNGFIFLTSLTVLEYLSIDRMFIRYRDVNDLMKSKKLKSLTLRYVRLRSDYLLSRLNDLNLKYLDLSHSQSIDRESLEYISRLTSLKYLYLSYCSNIIEDDLLLLLQLKNLKRLKLYGVLKDQNIVAKLNTLPELNLFYLDQSSSSIVSFIRRIFPC